MACQRCEESRMSDALRESRPVAVPARPGAPGTDELLLEARDLPDGRVLPVFSTVRALVAQLGEAQPWAVLPLGRARQLAAAAGVGRVALDPVVTPEAWRWNPRQVAEYGQGRAR
jgi:hypothetical protein